jgi:hypothetical protein
MVKYTVCSYCNSEYTGASKRSRRDNKTQICAICAEFEAVSEFLIHKLQKPAEPLLETLYQQLILRFAPMS